jgi:hypothetical protein
MFGRQVTVSVEDDPYASYSDGRIKHMEMVQGVVARLGGNGFVIKGWAVTVAGAFQGFGITRGNAWLAVAAVLPTALFWFLDASFLRSERAFRILFAYVRCGHVEPFFMNATSDEFHQSMDENERTCVMWRTTILRPSLALFYSALIASAALIALSIRIWGVASHSMRP